MTIGLDTKKISAFQIKAVPKWKALQLPAACFLQEGRVIPAHHASSSCGRDWRRNVVRNELLKVNGPLVIEFDHPDDSSSWHQGRVQNDRFYSASWPVIKSSPETE
ncbi:hypothetical protein AV530_005854 [Patagioenas fasciata monilis]|uniref:Uncharacterized protein n=1 Tax=Patagioenas fasciata monilis TaxID=372326 RepID=A0A1V4JMU8_PATFA|nr:hypothetical protein AV530_005854 [Patagioenas fasciata monilis]